MSEYEARPTRAAILRDRSDSVENYMLPGSSYALPPRIAATAGEFVDPTETGVQSSRRYGDWVHNRLHPAHRDEPHPAECDYPSPMDPHKAAHDQHMADLLICGEDLHRHSYEAELKMPHETSAHLNHVSRHLSAAGHSTKASILASRAEEAESASRSTPITDYYGFSRTEAAIPYADYPMGMYMGSMSGPGAQRRVEQELALAQCHRDMRHYI